MGPNLSVVFLTTEGLVSIGAIAQIIFDFFLISGIVILWARYRKNDGDDPRMSRSLQLLQSKISILEDLSDRIDEQLQQASTLMEHKKKELDVRIAEVDRTLQTIQQSRDKSLEVAKIFQDRIPHAEIIERQRTIEYVKAARLAHEGVELSELVKQVNLPAGEVEFIAKMNREQLQFSLEELPDWATGAFADASAPKGNMLASISAETIATTGPVIEFPSRPTIELPKMNAEVSSDLAAIGERMRMAAGGVAPQPEPKTAAASASRATAQSGANQPAASAAAKSPYGSVTHSTMPQSFQATPITAPAATSRKIETSSKDTVMTSLLNKAATSINASSAIRAAASELAEIQNVEVPVLKPRAPEPVNEIRGNTIETLHTATPPKADAEVNATNTRGESVIVQKIVFPKIEVNQHLS